MWCAPLRSWNRWGIARVRGLPVRCWCWVSCKSSRVWCLEMLLAYPRQLSLKKSDTFCTDPPEERSGSLGAKIRKPAAGCPRRKSSFSFSSKQTSATNAHCCTSSINRQVVLQNQTRHTTSVWDKGFRFWSFEVADQRSWIDQCAWRGKIARSHPNRCKQTTHDLKRGYRSPIKQLAVAFFWTDFMLSQPPIFETMDCQKQPLLWLFPGQLEGKAIHSSFMMFLAWCGRRWEQFHV